MTTPTLTQARSAGIAIAVAAAVTSSSSGSFGKSLIEAEWSGAGVNLVRMGLSAAVLTPWMLWLVLRQRTSFSGQWSGIVVLGTLGMAGTALCYYNAVPHLPVAVAMMGMYTAPVLVLLWTWLVHKDIPNKTMILGAVVAVVGLGLVVGLRGDSAVSLVGIAWAMASAVCLASFFIASARASAELHPAVVACLALWVAALTVAVLGLVGAFSIRFGGTEVLLVGQQMSAAVPIALVVLISTVLSLVLAMEAVRRLGARLTSFVALSELLAALAIAWILLGEQPTSIQFLGAFLIIVGVVLVRRDGTPLVVDEVTASTLIDQEPPSADEPAVAESPEDCEDRTSG